MAITETAHVPAGLVVEIHDCPKYRGILNGKQGVVVTGEYGDIRITMRDMRNDMGESGDYYVARCYVYVPMVDGKLMQLRKWLRQSPIEKSKTPQYKEAERKIIMFGNYTVAFATYVDNTEDAIKVSGEVLAESGTNRKSYEFASFEGTLTAGDAVLVKSGHHGYAIAVVTGFREKLPNDDNTLEREIVCKVDVQAHFDRIDNRRRAAELKEQMERLYEKLAASDTKMMELLTQFKNLT